MRYWIVMSLAMLAVSPRITGAHDGQVDPGSPAGKAIAMFEQRVKQNPGSAMDRILLAKLYQREGSATRDTVFFAKAEESARIALQMRPGFRDAALALASAISGQHRFAEAVALVQPIVDAHPEDDPALLMLADAEMAMGEVSPAAVAYGQVAGRVEAPAIEARLAQVAQVRGDNGAAIDHIRRAVEQLESFGAEPQESNWYDWRLADLYLYTGQPQRARPVLEELLQCSPGDRAATLSLALAYRAEGRLTEAIDLMNQAIARSPDFAELAALSDLEALAGHTEKAEATQIRAISVGLLDRHLARPLAAFLIDHKCSQERALKLAEADLKLRHDVYAYDLLAWAQLANGQVPQAGESITRALAEGTRDAQILYHAGMIALASENPTLARARLEQAMQLNPYFSLSQRDEAISALAQLKSSQGGQRPTTEKER